MAKRSSHRPGIKKKAKQNPGYNPREVFQAAVGKFQSGLLHEARMDFRKLKKAWPEAADCGYFLSLIAVSDADYPEAMRQIREALNVNPSNPAFVCQLGNVYRLQDDLQRAIKQYRKALELDGENIEALINLGICLRRVGDLQGAMDFYQRAVEINGEIPEVHNNLGSVLLLQDDVELACDAFERAIVLNPRFAGAHHNLGRARLHRREMMAALSSLREAVNLEPDNTLFLSDLSKCLGQTRIRMRDEQLEKDLLRCLQLDRVDGGMLGQSVGHYLIDCTAVGELMRRIRNADNRYEFSADDISIFTNELLLMYLQREQVCNPDLEYLLTRLRYWLLEQYCNRSLFEFAALRDLLTALSMQCFYTEYVYMETEQETRLVKSLGDELARGEVTGDRDVIPILIYACYRSLHQHQELSHSLVGIELDDPGMQLIVRKQITEPQLEQRLRSGIKSISDLNNEISRRVRKQYEENPYPRWFQTDHPRQTGLSEYVLSLFPSQAGTLQCTTTASSVLVAGCGTGLQTVRDALRFRGSRVTGIDLSLSSLAYAKRMTDALKLNNVRYFQGDILDLERLDDEFDFIEAFGVLHHMDDPMQGWSCLRDKLKPDGFMRIGLYSYRARGPVRAAREYITGKNYSGTTNDIRNCRQELLSVDTDHPAWPLRHSPDFYSLSECRDLIFHVQEQQLDIAFIQRAMTGLELRFLGFEFPDSVAITRFKQQFPQPGSESDLDLWNEFEAEHPDTFVSQYVIWVTPASG